MPLIGRFQSLIKFTKALAAALGERDQYTRLHSERVVALSSALGKKSGLTAHELSVLTIAASFHDIGKIGIPDSVLLKPGELDEPEWEIMKTHPERSQRIVLAIEYEGVEEIAGVVRHHHEHFDGGGYPDRLSGEEIPPLSRILSIADAYDAIATPRSYHRQRTHGEIMVILAGEEGTKYDPSIARRFAEMIDHSAYKAAGT
jgi:HD-GYP domain-containing protein (c-di-GMP phosphodiesterase class II)